MFYPRIPTATYRLQFNHRFTLSQASELVEYFYELGISDFYASPIMKAQPGSLHGYDVLDHHQINPEIGTEQDLEKLSFKLKEKGMGLLLDIVPNHMCVSDPDNRWWNDVLENGPNSLYANYFNIVWDPPKTELKNKVLLPVLDQQYGKVIENQELKVCYEKGAFFLNYKSSRFPLNPRSWLAILKTVIKNLESALGDKHPEVLELQSIWTALDHLPSMKETSLDKSKERNREKEIIKKRLRNLTDLNPIVKGAIQEALKILNGVKGDPHSFDDLETMLKSQAYRLSYWRVTNDEINYHRFFDINSLASMRVENEEVFDAIHEVYLKFVKQGWVTGFRIDHVDGLFDPQQYFCRLQQACLKVLGDESSLSVENPKPFYVVVEKILVGEENLRSQWLVYGTTGYEYLNELNGVFVKEDRHEAFQKIYDQFIGYHQDMKKVIYRCKKLILIVSMSSELHILARHLEQICEQHRWSRDYTQEGLRFALRDIIACFPVYRSYIRQKDDQIDPEDMKYIISAIQQAKSVNPASDSSIFDFIESVLLLKDPVGLNEEQRAYRREFVMRFQQLTGPVMAKGFEDTAFYRSYPLASLNEVGMNPSSFGVSIDLFHQKNQKRLVSWPYTLLTTFTHDTKRSEDVRARLNVLTENPEAWQQALQRWREINQNKKEKINQQEVPDANEDYFLYQTLIGSWPLYSMDASAHAQYMDRIEQYMLKAIKEAKIHTSWINPNENYEKAVQTFIHRILDLDSSHSFLTDLVHFVQPILKAGLFNSLSQTLVKMTTPGVPDFYQGSELWEFTLVDPDNRRPVDYSNRKRLLSILMEKAKQDPLALMTHLMETFEDGRIKLYMIAQVLNFRRQYLDLFEQGSYDPIEVKGEKANHVIAYSRTKEQQTVIVAAGRFFTSLLDMKDHFPVGEQAWKDTNLSGVPKGCYRELLSGQEWTVTEPYSLPLASLFSKIPVVLLVKY